MTDTSREAVQAIRFLKLLKEPNSSYTSSEIDDVIRVLRSLLDHAEAAEKERDNAELHWRAALERIADQERASADADRMHMALETARALFVMFDPAGAFVVINAALEPKE